jgi:hypothetical protein
MHVGYPCPLDIHTLWIFMDRRRYILWDRVKAEHARWIFMHPGYPNTVDIQDIHGHYIIWDRLGPSMNCGYPCTGGEIYSRWGIHYLLYM